MQRLFILLALIVYFGLSSAWAQTRTITGVITSSEDRQPLPGVSIVVKGTTTGTVTDFDGKYTLAIPTSTSTIVVSFIGMETQEVSVEGLSTINVALVPETIGLEEVVAVAYGTQKKESITGAVSQVNATAIEKRPVSSVSSVLEGTTTGIQVNSSYGEPGSSPTIRIRGFTSINGSNDPLYVIDGVPFGGNISDLNPQDIESISVLKDAASSALYGSRASNGVVLITTKRGKVTSDGSANLRFSINQGVYNRGIKEYERLSADDFMETMWIGYRNNLMTSKPADYPTEAAASAEANNSLMSTILKYNIYDKPDASLFDANGKLAAGAKVRSQYNDLDWFKPIERLGYRQDYTVSGDGASEKTSYFFSAGYLDEKGYVISSDFKRFTGRANVDISPRKWIKVGMNISGSHQTSNNTTGDAGSATSFVNPFYYARNMAPIYPIYLHDLQTGELILDANGDKQYDGGSAYSRPQNVGRHVIWETELNMDRTYRNTMQSQAYVDIKFLNDFKFSVKGDINLRNSENQTYNNAVIGDGSGNKGRARRVLYRYKNYTFQQQLMWDKVFDKHTVDALVAHENYDYNYSYLYGYKTTETFAGGTELKNFTNITSLDGYQNTYRTESYLSRARYNYDNKYYFDASFRRDGSSRFYKDNRWGNFWSVGGSWSISRENFMALFNDKINSLKLRASYGEVGNDAGTGYYGYMALYGLDQNANLTAAYKTQNQAYDILWETSSSFGVGLEGRVYNRVNFSAEYFDKRSKNLLFDINLPLSAGANSTSSAEATITKNIGTISNTGVEVSVDVDVVKNYNWRWNVGVNATTLKNKIVRLPEQNREKGIISGTKRYVEGHGIYDFWMYKYAGVDQMTGNALYVANLEDYYISTPEAGKSPIPADQVVEINNKSYVTNPTYALKDWSGSAIPDVYGSISSALSYKNLSLNMLFTYSLGGKVLDYSYQSLMSVTTNPSAIHKDVLKSWSGIPAGMAADSKNRIDANGIPVVNYHLSQYTNATSDRFLLDASYLMIKNIALNYSFPKHILNKLDISGLSMIASVENLATFTSVQGMNPQQSFSGINNNAFVTARVFSLGINIRL